MNESQTCFQKDRLVSLMYAVLAIIMTLLVLNLDSPQAPTLEGFWALGESYFAYMLSFFWLGILWLALNRLFAQISQVNHAVMILGLVMLFVCSLVPYLTLLASEDFDSGLVQTIFGLCTGIVNLLLAGIMEEIRKTSGKNRPLLEYIAEQKRLLVFSFLLKMAGIVLCWTIWPPLVMVSIIASAFLSFVFNLFTHRKGQDSCLGF